MDFDETTNAKSIDLGIEEFSSCLCIHILSQYILVYVYILHTYIK